MAFFSLLSPADDSSLWWDVVLSVDASYLGNEASIRCSFASSLPSFCGSAAVSIALKHIQIHFGMKHGPVETPESAGG